MNTPFFEPTSSLTLHGIAMSPAFSRPENWRKREPGQAA
jgi:hypothetical protein